MAVGSTDKNGEVIEGFVARYIDMEELVVKEHYIDVVPADNRSPSGIRSRMLMIDLPQGFDHLCWSP